MTDGVHPAVVDPDDPPPAASPAVPRLVPSQDVPDTEVVGSMLVYQCAKSNTLYIQNEPYSGTQKTLGFHACLVTTA